MSILERIKDALTSDWKTIEGVTVFDPKETPAGTGTKLTFYDARVQEHRETGERRLRLGNHRGEQLAPVSKDQLPEVEEGSTAFGLGRVIVYNADYVRDTYNIDE